MDSFRIKIHKLIYFDLFVVIGSICKNINVYIYIHFIHIFSKFNSFCSSKKSLVWLSMFN